MPNKDDFVKLFNEHGQTGHYQEKVHDWKMTEAEIAHAGLSRRTTKDAIKLTRGLRSGERNTDMTNTLLNRV